jgi:hypothetical protein
VAHASHRLRAAFLVLSSCVILSGVAAGEQPGDPVPAAGIESVVRVRVERAALKTGLGLSVLQAALGAYRDAAGAGEVRRAVLTVIDYSLPSRVRRLWVLDLARGTVLAHELVAHGRGSGDDMARRFSNAGGSYESSLGAFVTADRYEGANGLSLRLQGLDEGLNDHAMERGIVMHGAWYVSDEMIRRSGRLGRSEGCPAVSTAAASRIIGMIEGGSVLFAYYPGRALPRAASRGIL